MPATAERPSSYHRGIRYHTDTLPRVLNAQHRAFNLNTKSGSNWIQERASGKYKSLSTLASPSLFRKIVARMRTAALSTMSTILSVDPLSFPFATDSPFLFGVHHDDRYPKGNAKMGPDASLRGHSIGADFGNPAGWSMYHGEGGVPGFPQHPHRGFETITVTVRGFIDHRRTAIDRGQLGAAGRDLATATCSG